MNNVTLRKFEQRDVENKVKWINDERNNQFLHYQLPLTVEGTSNWYSNIKDRIDRYDAVIELGDKPVGVIGLLSITEQDAEYYVTLGENSVLGKGVSTKATYLLLDYAFDVLGLKMVYLYTEVENIPAQRLFEKVGFIKKDLLKNSAVNRGKYIDRFYYEITENDYKKD